MAAIALAGELPVAPVLEASSVMSGVARWQLPWLLLPVLAVVAVRPVHWGIRASSLERHVHLQGWLGASRFGEKRSLSTGFPGIPGLSHETERGNSFFDVDGQICWKPIASSAYYIGGGDNEKMDSI